MKISTRTRYGTRLMLALALEYGNGPVLLKDIADREEISEKYLSQIIIPLRAQGLVNSFRGARGGYCLARPPSQISIRDIMEVLEGNLSLVKCVMRPSDCNRVSRCVTRQVWMDLGHNILQCLSGTSLQDLVSRYEEKSNHKVLMYNI